MKAGVGSRRGGNRVKARAANTVRRKRRRAGRRRLHGLVIILFLLSAGAVLCLTMLFKIEAVNVAGTDKYTPEEIAAASGIEIGSNLFRIDKQLITDAIIAEFPYIESVEINRKLPPAVEIHVTQSVPDGAVKEGDNYVLITKDGKVLERGIMYIPETVPLITGLDTEGVQPGHYIGLWEKTEKKDNETDEEKALRNKSDEEKAARAERVKEALTMLTYLYEAMNESGFTKITNVDITDRLNMKIMHENRLLLELGSEADMSYKLELLKVIINEKLEPEARGTLFVGNARDKKVIFRPAGDYETAYEEFDAATDVAAEAGEDEAGSEDASD